MYRHQYRQELNGLELMGSNHWRNLGDDFWNSRGAPAKENRWNWNPERQVIVCVIYSFTRCNATYHRYGILCRMFIILLLFKYTRYSPYTIFVNNKKILCFKTDGEI